MQVGQTTLLVSENSIGAKATTVKLVDAITPAVDCLLDVQIKISTNEAKLQVKVTDNTPVEDTGYLNGGANLIVDRIYAPGEIQLWAKNGYSYEFSMVFSSGAPVCDMLQIAQVEILGDR